MSIHHSLCAALSALAFCAGVAQAAPVAYNEWSDGDLGDMPGAVLALDAGLNRISGTTHFAVSDGPVHFDRDFDSFAFSLAAGQRITGITLSFKTTSFNAARASADFALCASAGPCSFGSAGYLGDETADYLAGGAPQVFDFGDVGALGALGAGIYAINQRTMGISAISLLLPTESWSADYVWTVSVTELPEPGSLALVAAALVAMRRRAGSAGG